MVAVVGTTEEGQVDSVDKIVELREKLYKEGIYFYLHVDAAYGGYARALFLNEAGEFVPYESLPDFLKNIMYLIMMFPLIKVFTMGSKQSLRQIRSRSIRIKWAMFLMLLEVS